MGFWDELQDAKMAGLGEEVIGDITDSYGNLEAALNQIIVLFTIVAAMTLIFLGYSIIKSAIRSRKNADDKIQIFREASVKTVVVGGIALLMLTPIPWNGLAVIINMIAVMM